ncbi:MAG: phosphatase PAP2 family protein [Bacilli bacterium]|nr:phosphatase PAP2 family protein [Bacilli bacterium]
MKDEIRRNKLATFSMKYHLNFLVLVLALFLLNGICYEITAMLPLTNHHLFMEIDNHIPFIPEFCFFYTTYYVSPVIFLYGLSFYDKKKFMTIFLGGAIGTILCLIVYLIYNVQMIRPEDVVEPYWFFNGSVHNIHEFFLALVHVQYVLDPFARNGIPSLHAFFGGLVSLSGFYFAKSEKHVPIAFRIIAALFGLCVACSTFFVKQHYFIDAVIGYGLSIALYFVSKPIVNKLTVKYKDKRLTKLLTEDTFVE